MTLQTQSRSRALFADAQTLMPGGVNSPVRAFHAVGGEPLFISRGEGPFVIDADGNRYLDFVGSWGPLILGHAYPAVVAAVRETVANGTGFGAPTALEVDLARLLREAIPSMERLRLVNSGTEAVMSALRLARGFTGRDGIVKFEGGYHGHVDSLLVKAGSGGATFGTPDSLGVPQELARLTHTLPYNDSGAVTALFKEKGPGIAAVIVEPVAGNMGVVPPRPGFLDTLREQTSRAGALLIFDEVMTGFRVGWGGAQGLYGITPDLTCLGKIIGGGLPVGAYGGRTDIMNFVAPLGGVYQAGTLAGNPVSVAAGLATLRAIQATPAFYETLERHGAALEAGLREAAGAAKTAVTVNRVGSMLTLFFTDRPVRNFKDAATADTGRYAGYFRAMLGQGMYLAPSQFEAAFVSGAHAEAHIAAAAAAARKALGA